MYTPYNSELHNLRYTKGKDIYFYFINTSFIILLHFLEALQVKRDFEYILV